MATNKKVSVEAFNETLIEIAEKIREDKGEEVDFDLSFADDSLLASTSSDDCVFNDTNLSGLSDTTNASGNAETDSISVSNDITSSISDRVDNEVSRKRSHAELVKAYNTGEKRFERGFGLSSINNEVINFKPVSNVQIIILVRDKYYNKF